MADEVQSKHQYIAAPKVLRDINTLSLEIKKEGRKGCSRQRDREKWQQKLSTTHLSLIVAELYIKTKHIISRKFNAPLQNGMVSSRIKHGNV